MFRRPTTKLPRTVGAGGAFTRRALAKGLALGGAGIALRAWAQKGDGPVRIGYVIARTGAWAAGAQVSQEPNYVMWAEQVNAAGGLDVAGRKRRVELIGLDDHSDIETCTRSYVKLMGGDKVDLILPPWGSSANFALAPITNRYGYPLVAPTALSRKLVDMGLPYFFSVLQQPDKMMGALLDMLVAKGVRSIVIMYMDDLFGLENFSALNQALKKTPLQVLDRKTYPLGVNDLAPILAGFKALNPDAFVGITYPPDTLLASRQAREAGFNPKFFYTSVGTAFQLYKTVLQAGAEGVLGMGSWNAKTSPPARAYFDAHVRRFNKEPDRWASGHCWAALQILEQAVARVGLDRKALRDQIAKAEFSTILGPVRFDGSENASVPGTVAQWQGGEFEVVWPPERATAPLIAPKPAWK
ncbi:MAG TPA: amino acid ABC transporter substrate-binding protein [Burkholderiaceae bacterium]|nr:amino acid ABC transporter substrate-binding protein [Burkholderiaceae bacterium]